jgi:hypothetical protein
VVSTADAELVAELARLRAPVERSAAAAQGEECARLRLEVAQLRRTEATLREADDRQRLQIAEQAALIGALQARLKPRPLCGQGGCTTCLATVAGRDLAREERERGDAAKALRDLEGTRGYPSDPEARAALRVISEEVPP